jgi:ribosomal protein S18 acetylase RimI-like enzyme
MESNLPPAPYHVRQFRYPEDYPAVIELWQSAGPGIQVRRSDQPEEIAKKLTRDPDLFLVAEKETGIVGTVLGGFDGRRGMIYHLAVTAAERRHGLGETLMNELERRLRAKGCIRAYLLVTLDNLDDAGAFYARRGWEHMTLATFGKDLNDPEAG